MVKRGAVKRRLRVRIDGKTYACGDAVRCGNGAVFYVHSIHSSGLVKFMIESTGLAYTIQTKGISDTETAAQLSKD